MKFAFQINSSPYHNKAGFTAYRFIRCAHAEGHQILRVFFYHEGIYHAFKYSLPPDDESHLTKLWSQLAEDSQIDLVVCISAAQRRGLLHEDEAQRQGKTDNGLAAGFRIAGLGQWLAAIIAADRVLVFG